MAFFLTLFMMIWCARENARRDAAAAPLAQGGGSGDGIKRGNVNELTEEEKRLEGELADDVPWFRYTV